MHNFQELRVWQEAMNLVVEVYRITRQFPPEEKYGLTSQLRKSAVSIPSNIAEGAGRNTNNEFYHFLGISNGSSCELQTQLLVAKNENYADPDEMLDLFNKTESVKRMAYKLQLTLK